MAHAKLTPEVTDILNRSNITGNVLILPPGQLKRKLYESVNAALVNAGGKWNRSAKGHVFASDPRAKLGLMLETGVSEDTKKTNQAFYTPAALARRVVLMASVEGKRVLEPSAGEGALADACREAGAEQVVCVELAGESCKVLKSKGYIAIKDDFLSISPVNYFSDRVVMNPPFSNRQDLKHVRHAMKFLKPGGRLVAIMQGNRTVNDIRKFVGDEVSILIERLDAGEFKESGTNIVAQIVTIDN